MKFSAFLRDCLAGKHRLKRNKRWKTPHRGNPTMLQPASSHRCINYYRVRAIASAALTFNYRASFAEPGGLTLCRRESWKKPAKRADQVLRRYSHQALTRFVLSVSGSSQVIAKINKLSRQRLGKGGKVFVLSENFATQKAATEMQASLLRRSRAVTRGRRGEKGLVRRTSPS